jgi:transcriptional regulator with XRE-family HTH domain
MTIASAPADLLDFIERNGITQSDICRACSIDPGYLNRILARKQVPSIAVAKRIKAATFGAVHVEDWVP